MRLASSLCRLTQVPGCARDDTSRRKLKNEKCMAKSGEYAPRLSSKAMNLGYWQ